MSAVDERNRETSAREVEGFKTLCPARYFAYHTARGGNLKTGQLITTWMGDHLATITAVGTPWRSNFGDWRQAFTCRARNATYHGVAYLSAGDYVRIRKATTIGEEN